MRLKIHVHVNIIKIPENYRRPNRRGKAGKSRYCKEENCFQEYYAESTGGVP